MKTLLLGAVVGSSALVSFSNTQAQAEIFVVEDQQNRFSVSFPDTWAEINNQKPDDKLTIAAQGVNEFVECRVRVRNEERYLVYPEKLAAEVQRQYISRDFWDLYLGEYNEVDVISFKDDAGLGYGHASMVEASYETADSTIVRKKGLAFASVYGNNLYILECSSEETVYDKWRPAFLSIVKSVDFKRVSHPNSEGYYRDFNGGDEQIEIEGPQELDAYKL
ncbi:MAG: PsbP-related protein [Alphaproteobacteria bacterium]